MNRGAGDAGGGPAPPACGGSYHRSGRSRQTGVVDNQELQRRYQAGDPLADLAAAAGMSLGGLQRRLRRIGVSPRQPRSTVDQLDADQIAAALAAHGSIAAAARALGVGRAALTGRSHRLGVLERPACPSDLAGRYQAGASLTQLAGHYGCSVQTVRTWMIAAGIPLRPAGRRPRDG